jgi:polysaccharide pyruvyl transferase WcaK-like protein
MVQENADRAIIQALSGLCRSRPDLSILPLPMCTNFIGDDDRWYYRGLFERCPDVSRHVDFSLLGRELTPLEYLRRFEGADAVLSMRFHALVFALQCEVPVVALDYTLGRGKVAALAEQSGIACENFAQIDPDRLQSKLVAALSGARLNTAEPSANFDTVFQQSLRSLLRRSPEPDAQAVNV